MKRVDQRPVIGGGWRLTDVQIVVVLCRKSRWVSLFGLSAGRRQSGMTAVVKVDNSGTLLLRKTTNGLGSLSAVLSLDVRGMVSHLVDGVGVNSFRFSLGTSASGVAKE